MSKKTYAVHVYAVVRMKVGDVEAEGPERAARIGMDVVFDNAHSIGYDGPSAFDDIEWAEEIAGLRVDEIDGDGKPLSDDGVGFDVAFPTSVELAPSVHGIQAEGLYLLDRTALSVAAAKRAAGYFGAGEVREGAELLERLAEFLEFQYLEAPSALERLDCAQRLAFLKSDLSRLLGPSAPSAGRATPSRPSV